MVVTAGMVILVVFLLWLAVKCRQLKFQKKKKVPKFKPEVISVLPEYIIPMDMKPYEDRLLAQIRTAEEIEKGTFLWPSAVNFPQANWI